MRSSADVAVAAALALLACSPSSPSTQVKDALARSARVRVEAAGAEADLAEVRFSDVVVSMDGPRALVVAIAEAKGRVRVAGGEAALDYVGREAFAMERCAGSGWCAEGGPLPALRSVLAALPALGGEGARAAGGRIRTVAWQVRVERDRAIVGLDYEVGAPARRRERFELVRQGDAWIFAGPR